MNHVLATIVPPAAVRHLSSCRRRRVQVSDLDRLPDYLQVLPAEWRDAKREQRNSLTTVAGLSTVFELLGPSGRAARGTSWSMEALARCVAEAPRGRPATDLPLLGYAQSPDLLRPAARPRRAAKRLRRRTGICQRVMLASHTGAGRESTAMPSSMRKAPATDAASQVAVTPGLALRRRTPQVQTFPTCP